MIKPTRHNIKETDIDFLVAWIKSSCAMYPDMRGKVNGVSINFTEKFISIDSSGVLRVEEVGSGKYE